MGTTRRINIAFTGDASDLSRTMNRLKGQMSGLFGAHVMQKAISSVIDLGGSFEASMQKIVGLVGVAQPMVNRWADELKNLAGEVGKGPQELADALFFVTSAGIRTDEALRIVEESARLSAAGLGDMNDIARSTTAAMNAYKTSGLSAADAANVLAGTIREGNLEASTLAPVIGRVIPLASQLGVSFDEVGAAIAAMSRQGASASDATTYLLGIFRGLIKDTGQSKKAMSEFDTSIAAVRDTIEEKGLLAGLQSLKGVFDQNEDAATKVFGRIRGLTGYLSLMGDSADSNAQIFANLAGQTNFAGEAFDAISETANQKFREALAKLQVAGTDLGAEVLPHIVDMVERFSEVLAGDTIPQLGELLISIIETASGLTDTLVPALETAGDVIEGIGLTVDAMGSAGRNLWDALTPGRDVGNRFHIIIEALERSGQIGTGSLEEFNTLFKVLAKNGALNGETLTHLADMYGVTKERLSPLVKETIAQAEALGLSEEAIRWLTEAYVDADVATIDMSKGWREADEQRAMFEQGIAGSGPVIQGTIDDIIDHEVALENDAEAAEEAAKAQRDLIKAHRAAADPIFAAVDSLQKVEEAGKDAAEATKEFGENSIEARRAAIDLAEATLDASWAFDDLEAADVDEAVRQIALALGWTEQETRDLLTQMGLLGDQRPVVKVEVEAPVIDYVASQNSVKPVLIGGTRFAFAKGGIATDMTIAQIAEAGDSEAVIPLNERGVNFMADTMTEAMTRLQKRRKRKVRERAGRSTEDNLEKMRQRRIEETADRAGRSKERNLRRKRDREPKVPTQLVKQEQVIVVEFHIDGKKFARKIVKPMARELKRHRQGLRN